jgi:hypothetical protein
MVTFARGNFLQHVPYLVGAATLNDRCAAKDSSHRGCQAFPAVDDGKEALAHVQSPTKQVGQQLPAHFTVFTGALLQPEYVLVAVLGETQDSDNVVTLFHRTIEI